MDTGTCSALFLSVIVTCLLYILWKYHWMKNYWKSRGIPQVDGAIPIFGNILPVVLQRITMGEMLRKFYTSNDECSMIGFFNMDSPILILRDPELGKTVMQAEFSSFHANIPPVNIDNDPLLAKNPFFCMGEVWAKGRKRFTYAFSSMRLKRLAETARGTSKKLIDYLDRKMGNGKVEMEMKDLFSRFTIETIASVGFGMEGFCFTDEEHPGGLRDMGERLFKPTLYKAIKFSVLAFFPFLSRLFKISFMDPEVDKYFRDTVREILEIRRKEQGQRNDFFQLMADLEKDEGEEIDEEMLTSHVLSFFIDGYETSSAIMSLTSYNIAKYPDVQEKLRKEVKEVLARHKGVIGYDSLKEMTYLDQVINETLRIYPAGIGFTKECTNDFELVGSDGLTYKIKKGSGILVPAVGLHVDPKYWDEPEKYDPDRFGSANKDKIRKFTFLPFGEGPRACVGMRMAWLQMKIALATLINNYSLEISRKMQLPLKLDPKHFLPAPVGGAWLYIKPLPDVN